MKRFGRRFWRTIQGKLILLILVLFIPTLIIQACIYHDRLEARSTEERQANLEIARAAGRAFETFVQDVLHQELSIGLAITSSKPMASEDITRLLEKSDHDNLAIRDFSWMSPAGIVLLSSNPALVGTDRSDRSCCRDIAMGRKWAVSELVIARSTGKPIFSISRGIRDDKDVLLGIVVATVSPERLDAVLSVERAKGGGISIVDNRGMLVYRYPSVPLTWEERDRMKVFPQWREALDGKEITATIPGSYDAGNNRIIASTPIASLGWGAGAGSTEERAMESITSGLLSQAILFLLVTLAAFAAALVFSRFIVTPVKRLRDHALSLGKGETHKPAVASGPAELEELAESFNIMAEELRSREASLNEQREWLRVTLTSIGDAVMTTDTEGRITFLNPIAAALTGWSMEEATGKPALEVFRIVSEENRGPAEDIIGRVLHEQCAVALANHIALVARDGHEIPIEDSAAPIRDATGKVSGVVLVFHDVTESRRTREALRQSEAQLRTTLESLTEGVVISDLDGGILYWNRACLEMHGYADQEELLRRLPEFNDTFELATMKGEPLPLEQWPLSRILRGETVRDCPLRLRRLNDGMERIFLYGGTIARDTEGKPVVAFVSVKDITERRRMEEELRRARDELEVRVQERTVELQSYMQRLEQSNQALREFAYIASHDLQEPLRTVSSFVQLLERRHKGKLGSDADQYISYAVDGARRMKSLIDDLLQYSKLDTQGNPFEPTDMERVLKKTISSLRAGIENSGAIISHDPLPTLPVDPSQMARLFQNLIGNALKFHGVEPLKIHVSAQSRNGEWLFSIKDNGIGMDKKFSERIFKIFQRLHTKEEYPGTGIGLAVCKKIVERHGGKIWVESALGEGATFYFTVPVIRGDIV